MVGQDLPYLAVVRQQHAQALDAVDHSSLGFAGMCVDSIEISVEPLSER